MMGDLSALMRLEMTVSIQIACLSLPVRQAGGRQV